MCKEQFAKDINRAVFPGLQGGPHDHINAAKAVAFKEALEPSFKNYAKRIIVNAQTLASELQKFGFRIISGGTDNHLMLIDMTSRGLSGKEAEIALDKAGLSTNKNMIPFDTRKPLDPSGIRLGTPAITTRGMKEKEIIQIASWINDAVTNFDNDVKLNSIKNEVKNLAQKFPVPGI
jgi:glycine hydroxymethyltransferase